MSVKKQEQGHRWFAAMYDRMSSRSERGLLKKVRPRIIGEAKGRVLEIGVGTGGTFEFYSPEAHLVGIEPDPHMLKRAEKRLAEMGASNIELHQAPAENLPFEDASFDHVVSSLVLCTVRDVPRGLAEARRTLKPDGTFRFLEHVRNDDSRFWGTVQDLITPAWGWFSGGCHPNRRTQEAIEEAGFRIEWLESVRMGPGMPGIYGVARPAQP